MPSLIEIAGLRKTYHLGGSEVKALDGVSLSIGQGEFVALIGPSGSGKSTLLHILGFLDRPDAGSYRFAGHPTEGLGEKQLAALRSLSIGFVFQSFHLLPRYTASQNVGLPLVYSGAAGRSERVAKGLGLVGIADRAEHTPAQLSGGQQQRVAVARAIVNDPRVILADEPTGNLDSRSRGDVIALLRSLSEKGITVVIVTHDPEVAAQARRVIRLKDGLIVSDERGGEEPARAGGAAALRLPKARSGFTLAELEEQVRVAFSAVWSHKMRSALTMLGILIGVGSIIALMSVSQGFMKDMLGKAETEEAKTVVVFRNWHRGSSVAELRVEDAEDIKAACPSVEKAEAHVQKSVQLTRGKKALDVPIHSDSGVLPLELRKSPGGRPERWLKGRWISPQDDKSRARVVVLNETAAMKLFGDEEAVGQDVRINKVPFSVIGVEQDSKGGAIFGGLSKATVPLSTAMRRLFGQRTADYILAEAISVDAVQDARREIILLLRKKHGYREGQKDDYEVQTARGRIQAFTGFMGKFSMFVYAVAALSLLVGGIGIMNIMLVSVTERTREIGLRKSLGARRSDILLQFLVEAVVLCLLGGFAGVLLGYGLAWGSSFITHVTPAMSLGIVLTAVSFSTAIGVVFGFWPALRASDLSPIEALRSE